MLDLVKRTIEWRGDRCVVTVSSPFVTVPETVTLTVDQAKRFVDWERTGIKIQDALPDLTDDDREIILTGIGPAKWEEMFGEDDDD